MTPLKTYTQDNLMFVGGMTTPVELAAFWNHIDFANLSYVLLDTTSDGVQFGSSGALPTLDLLRAHIFGSGGDLSVRRDENRVLWRYVGDPMKGLTELAPESFFVAYPGAVLEEDPEPLVALLWGDYDDNRQAWYDNRVGTATLNYPIDTTHRVQVQAKRLRLVSGAQDDDLLTVAAIWTFALLDAESETK